MKEETKMKKLAKYFIIYVGVILINNTGFAQTNVSGVIFSDTTWAVAGSPYIVTGSVLVDSGVTLTIEPGVTVKFNSGMSFQIDGALMARGAETDKITFTTNSGGDYWGYILFTDSSTDATYDTSGNYTGSSILEHCIVEYAGVVNVGNNGSIRLNNAHPLINSCTIRNNVTSGINAWDLSGTLKITNNTISNNIGGGIDIRGRTVTISNNTISNNVAYDGGGIHITGGTLVPSYVTISNNIINNNTATGSGALNGGGGIYTSSSYVTISNNMICNNTAVRLGGGIHAKRTGAKVTISNNIISNNTAGHSGGGIHAYYNFSLVISSNSIIANSSGIGSAIHLWDAWDYQIEYNTITENRTTGEAPSYTVFVEYRNSLNYNNIFGNIADSPPLYEFYNGSSHGSTNINATNNWWGTTSDSVIPSMIYDWFDNGSLGIVDYIPYLSTPDTTAPVSPPPNVVKSVVSSDVQLTWDPNPELDLVGYKVHYGSPTGYSFVNVIDVGNVTNYTVSGVSIFDTIAVTAYDIIADGVNDQLEGHESWFTIATTPYGDVSLNGEMTPYDASLILKYLVDYIDLNSQQLQNANVSLDTTVSALDASLILQYFVGLIDTLPYDTTSGLLLASGDMKMDDGEIQAGQPVEVLLYLSNGDNILSFEGIITFNPEHLTFDTLTWSELVDGFTIETNAEAGEIKFAGAGSVSDGEGGVFAILRFVVNENLTEDETVIALQKLRWNENEVMENVASATLTNTTSVDVELIGVPTEFGLGQNYPNPFNPETTISYELPRESDVTLTIYDITGRLVETLVDQKQNGGQYSVQWDASSKSSGVYFYKISTGEFQQVRKCLLVK